MTLSLDETHILFDANEEYSPVQISIGDTRDSCTLIKWIILSNIFIRYSDNSSRLIRYSIGDSF